MQLRSGGESGGGGGSEYEPRATASRDLYFRLALQLHYDAFLPPKRSTRLDTPFYRTKKNLARLLALNSDCLLDGDLLVQCARLGFSLRKIKM